MLNYEKIDKMEFEKIMKRRRMRTYIAATLMIMSLIYIAAVKSYESVVNKCYCKYLINMDSGNYDIEKLRAKREEYEKNINIQNVEYDMDSTIKSGNKPKVLVIHHTASDNLTPEMINEDHRRKGYGGIGYHFYIRRNGEVYRGRSEECIGAHTIGRNGDSIGICLEGNFEEEDLTEEEEKSLIMLSSDMIIKYNISDIIGHKDVYATLCPGKNISLEDIKERVKNEVVNISK